MSKNRWFTPSPAQRLAIAADGGAAIPDFTGAGSPEGVVTAAVGKSYLDTTTGTLYFKTEGSGNTGWSANGLSPDYVTVLGKATSETPFGDGGLYDPGSAAPEDGAWMDAYWGNGVAWTWGLGPLSDPVQPVVYLERTGTSAMLSVQDNLGHGGIVRMLLDAISGAQFTINAANGQTAPLVAINGGTDGDTPLLRVLPTGDVEIFDHTAGVILHSPNNTRYRLTVADDGTVSGVAV